MTRSASTKGTALRAPARQVLLAGLAALSTLHDEEDDDLFQQLVEEGRRLLAKTRSELWSEGHLQVEAKSLSEKDIDLWFQPTGPGSEGGRMVIVSMKPPRSTTSPDWAIDAAARTAARHPSLQGRSSDLRSLLAWETLKKKIAEELAGGPRHVVTAAELQEERQVRIAGEAIAAIWQEKVLESRQVALALGAKASNREKVSSLRRRSALLGLPREQGYLYPAFQIDSDRRALYPEVRQVNEILGAELDPWGVASWWFSVNDRLGTRPADLVGSQRAEEVVRAARAATAAVG